MLMKAYMRLLDTVAKFATDDRVPVDVQNEFKAELNALREVHDEYDKLHQQAS